MIRFLTAVALAFAAAFLLTTPGTSLAGVAAFLAGFVLLISSFAHPARALTRRNHR